MHTYTAQNYKHLLGLDGLSDKALETHFTLYEGYVANVNKIATTAEELLKTTDPASPVLSELRRRFGWEFNGMRLHELYFESLVKGGQKISTNLSEKLAKAFGSYEAWEKDFRALSSMRGIGWAILYQDLTTSGLFNVWINEHDVGHLAGAVPLLVCDVFEHAFMIDYGPKRVGYIDAFMKAIDWTKVENRIKE